MVPCERRGGVVHIGAMPWAGSGFRMEVYGREGTLFATGKISSQLGESLRLKGARGGHTLCALEVPARFRFVPAEFPQGEPHNSARCTRCSPRPFAAGKSLPNFDTAVDLHRLLDAIKQASDTGRELPVA